MPDPLLGMLALSAFPPLHIACTYSAKPTEDKTDAKAESSITKGSQASAQDAYIAEHGEAISQAIRAVVREVVDARHPTPVEAIGKLLMGHGDGAEHAAARNPSSSGKLPEWYKPLPTVPSVQEAPPKTLDDKIDELRTHFPGKTTDTLRKMLEEVQGDVSKCIADSKS